MMGYKFFLDTSHHNVIDYDEVKKHIDGGILRLGFGDQDDTLFEPHYDGLKELPLAAYLWLRPDRDIKAQIELVKRRLDGKEDHIRVVISDQEQEGRYNIPLSNYTPTVLSQRGQAFVTGLATHGFDMGVYSRTQWIMAYAKPMLGWIDEYIHWWASYPYARDVVRCSWDDLINKWAPKVFSPYLAPGWPTNMKKADAWQWSGDKFIVPGIYTNDARHLPRTADFNWVSDALYARIVGGTPPPPLPPTDAEKLRILWEAHYG